MPFQIDKQVLISGNIFYYQEYTYIKMLLKIMISMIYCKISKRLYRTVVYNTHIYLYCHLISSFLIAIDVEKKLKMFSIECLVWQYVGFINRML